MIGLKQFARLGLLKKSPPQCISWYGKKSIVRRLPVLIAVSATYHKFYSTESERNVSEIPKQDLKTAPLLEVMNNMGVDVESFNHAISVSPDLLNTSPSQWEKCFYELIHNGFTPNDCLKMITAYPPLLRLKQGHISSALECWRNSQLGDSRVISLLRTCPHFICIDFAQIPRRIPLLRSLSAQKNVTNLLKGSPNVMFEKWSQVMAKIDYLENVMKVEKNQIIKTFALNRTLNFIKTRHVFLDRCGVYVAPKPKADPNEPSKNPPLSSITDTDDEYFVTRVAGLTLEELEVFQDLYMEELEKEDSDDSESDNE